MMEQIVGGRGRGTAVNYVVVLYRYILVSRCKRERMVVVGMMDLYLLRMRKKKCNGSCKAVSPHPMMQRQ